MKKLLIITSLFLILAQGFAQENTNTEEVTLEEAQTESKGLMKELFMFQMAKDVLETRQLISDNELGDSIEKHMTDYDNALFFKSTLDYDFFWNSVLGRKKYKVPSSQLFLDSKEKYLENNEVGTSIDFDIVLKPNWEDPAKEDKLKDYSVKIIPGNYTNISFSEDEEENFNSVLNSPFATNVNTPKDAKVNEAVFDGLAALRNKLDRRNDVPIINMTVNFTAYEEQFFGFDKLTYDVHKPTYQQLKINGKDQYLPWKSISSSGTDQVLVKFSEYDESINPDKIKYKTSSGINLTATKFEGKDDAHLLSLTGKSNEVVEEVIAFTTYKNNAGTEKDIKVGSFNTITYDKLKINLVIVPVNGSAGFSADDFTKSLNEIYKQSVVEWNVTLDEVYNINESEWDDDSDHAMNDGESTFLSNYSDEQKNFKSQYKKDRDVDKNSYYVFLLNNIPSKSGLKGYMPLKEQYAFIHSATAENAAQLIAHELGHGAFRLWHTFSSESSFFMAKNSSNNLMDYKDGKRLHKYQWDKVHNPDGGFYMFQDEEEGASRNENTLISIVEKLRCAHISITTAAIEKDNWPYLGFWTDNLDIGKEEKIKYIELQVSDDGNYGPFDSYTKKDVIRPYITGPTDEDRISLTFKTGEKSLNFIICKSQEQFVINYLFPKPEIWKQELENQIISLNTALDQEISDDYEKRIVNILSYLSDCAYQNSNLDGKLRGELINVMSHYLTLKIFGGSIPENEENIILKLLLTTKDSDVKVLVEKLLEVVSQEQLLKRLDEGFSDIEFLFKDQNYKNFAGIIWELIEKAYPINDKLTLYQKLHKENKVFRWTRKINGGYYNSYYSDDGNITVSYDEVVGTSNADYNGYLTLVENTEKREFPLQAKEYVYIHFEVDIPALDVKKGDICFVPSYVLHHLIEDRVNENTATLIRVGIDVASIAVGVGVIKSGVTGAALFLEILEIGTAIGDIALTGFEEELSKTPEGAKFLKTFNTIAIVGGIANIGQAGIAKLNSTIPEEIISLRNAWNNSDVKSMVTAENPTVASQIDNLVDELDEYEELVKYGEAVNVLRKSKDDLYSILFDNTKKTGEIVNNGVVRNIYEVEFNVNGTKKTIRILEGDNDKVAIIGLGMNNNVKPFASSLTDEYSNLNIELFDEVYQTQKFNIDGGDYTWEQITADLTGEYPINVYTRDASGWVVKEDIEKTLMFKANRQFAQKLKDEGYVIIDLERGVDKSSQWYNMEIETIFK